MIKDTELERKLNKTTDKLERLIDYIGPTPLRHALNEKIVDIRLQLRNYRQEDEE